MLHVVMCHNLFCHIDMFGFIFVDGGGDKSKTMLVYWSIGVRNGKEPLSVSFQIVIGCCVRMSDTELDVSSIDDSIRDHRLAVTILFQYMNNST